MSVPVTACPRCGTRRSARDIASGAAMALNGTVFCTTCVPASVMMGRRGLSERQTLDSGSDVRPPQHTPASGRFPRTPAPLSPTPPSPTPPSARLSQFPAPPSPSPDASRRSSARRPRVAPRPERAPEPFPWGLALAGVLVASVSTVLLAFLLRTFFPPPAPPPAPAPPAAPVAPSAGPTARELADALILRARACEAQNDLESACLALELPEASPILGDPSSANLVAKERERLARLRDTARARRGR